MLETLRSGIQEKGLKDLIHDLPNDITMAEIGSYHGESALLFLNSGKINKLYAIDTWIESIFKIAEDEFDKKLDGKNVVKLKMTMNQAIQFLPKLDMVYIDGAHSYKLVKKDILASLKVIKKDGIIAGHDYSDQYKDRVVKAVDEILGTPDKIYIDTSWIIWMNEKGKI